MFDDQLEYVRKMRAMMSFILAVDPGVKNWCPFSRRWAEGTTCEKKALAEVSVVTINNNPVARGLRALRQVQDP